MAKKPTSGKGPNPLLEAALMFKSSGFNPWPVDGSNPLRAGYDQRTWLGRQHQALTEAEIAATWDRPNPPGLALVLGPGQAVLDLDPKNDPAVVSMFDALDNLTLTASTPHDGLHAFFTQPDGAAVRIIHGKGFDLLGHGSLVVVPPSPNRAWREGRDPASYPMTATTDVYESVTDFLKTNGISIARVESEFISEDDRIIPDHARNNTLVAIAGVIRKIGLAPNLLEVAIRALGTDVHAIESPLDDLDIENIVNSINSRRPADFELDGMTIQTLNFDDLHPASLKWRIPDFIPDETVTLLYGLPAQGKSWVATIIAVVVALGSAWPGNGERALKGRVLYCDWERRGAMVQRRLKAYLKGASAGSIDYIAMRGSLSDGLATIRSHVATRGYQLIIIDSLTIAMMGADVSTSSAMVPAMFELQELCDDFGLAIVALDHQKKNYENENPWASGAFGSIFKEAVATMVWQCGKVDARFTDGYMDFKLHLRKKNHERAIEDIIMRLTFEFDDAGEIHAATIEPINAMGIEAQVIDWLGQRGEMDTAQLLSGMTVSKDTLRRTLDRLVADAMIICTKEGGRGRGNTSSYMLAPEIEGDV